MKKHITVSTIITILIISIELVLFIYGYNLVKRLYKLETNIEIYECNIDSMEFNLDVYNSRLRLVESSMKTYPEEFIDSYKALKNEQAILKDEIYCRKLLHNEQVKIYKESVNNVCNKFFIKLGGFRVHEYEPIF